jgi:hypothetical protein
LTSQKDILYKFGAELAHGVHFQGSAWMADAVVGKYPEPAILQGRDCLDASGPRSAYETVMHVDSPRNSFIYFGPLAPAGMYGNCALWQHPAIPDTFYLRGLCAVIVRNVSKFLSFLVGSFSTMRQYGEPPSFFSTPLYLQGSTHRVPDGFDDRRLQDRSIHCRLRFPRHQICARAAMVRFTCSLEIFPSSGISVGSAQAGTVVVPGILLRIRGRTNGARCIQRSNASTSYKGKSHIASEFSSKAGVENGATGMRDCVSKML